MDLTGVVFVGHSAASMIGVLAAVTDPSRFAQLVLVCPSPRYIDDADSGYIGGFSEEDINGLIGSLAANQREWADAMAPVIMGNADRPELAAELHASLCRTDPKVAAAFATATFRSDQRAELPKLTVPTVIVQTTEDAIAPQTVGQYTHDHIPDSTLLTINAVGHCPHFSAPLATADAIGRALPR
jgi:sigma-B regulation protein RsbQ